MVPRGRGLPTLTLMALTAACAGPSDARTPTNADPGAPPVATAATAAVPASVVAARSSSTSSLVTPPAPTVPPPRTIDLAFTGDTLPHSPLWRQAERNAGGAGFDFRPMLALLEPIVAPIDLAICHLETPIAPLGEEFSTMPYYGVPAEIADAIAVVGYDRCSTASNHTADRGGPGIDRTVEVLESVGLGQSGMARTPDEIEPKVFEVGGVRVSHLSYTFSYNGLSLPDGEEWRSATIDPARIAADASAARALGAEFVIVSMHWGSEGSSGVTVEQRRIAEEITASGAIDLVVGHHAHVVQPIEEINGVWVVFGLGNILSNLPTSDRWPASSQDGMVVTISVTVGTDGASVARPEVHPTWVDKADGWVVRPVLEQLADPMISRRIRSELERSLDRTAGVVGDFLPAPGG